MASIVGVYNSPEKAKGALGKLLNTGFKFDNDNVSLIVSGGNHDVSVSGSEHDTAAHLIKGSAYGAVAGGIIAALLTGYVATGSIIILRKELLHISGHLVAAAAGASLGAIAGAVAGFFITAVVNAYKEKRGQNTGKAVVIIHTKDWNTRQAAEKVLREDNVPLKVAY